MRRFTRLYFELDATNRTGEKVAALERYFAEAPPADAAWALYFLTGRRLKRAVAHMRLREWAAQAAGLPLWLLEECYDAVGDLSETIALLLPGPGQLKAPGLTRAEPSTEADGRRAGGQEGGTGDETSRAEVELAASATTEYGREHDEPGSLPSSTPALPPSADAFAEQLSTHDGGEDA